MKFNTRYNPPVVAGVTAAGGLTDQHQKDDCDLNVVLRRYRVGGVPPPPAARFEDLTDAPKDLQDAFDRVAEAREWFATLPSDVRLAYGNDPRNAIAAALSGDAAELARLFPDNHSKAASAATPEPPEAAKAPPSGAVEKAPSPEHAPAS